MRDFLAPFLALFSGQRAKIEDDRTDLPVGDRAAGETDTSGGSRAEEPRGGHSPGDEQGDDGTSDPRRSR